MTKTSVNMCSLGPKPEQAAAVAEIKAGALDRHNNCTAALKQGRPYVVRWLDNLEPVEREHCRRVLNQMRVGK